MQENSCFKLLQMSNYHWLWKNEQHLNIDYNFDHQMPLRKSKCLYSNIYIYIFKVCCSSVLLLLVILECLSYQRLIPAWKSSQQPQRLPEASWTCHHSPEPGQVNMGNTGTSSVIKVECSFIKTSQLIFTFLINVTTNNSATIIEKNSSQFLPPVFSTFFWWGF